MPEDDYIVFGRPNVGEEEIEAVAATMRSGWVGTGPRVAEFQKRFADYIGTEHAVAMGSCTATLHVFFEAAGIGAGDEVITTPLTFAATANAVVHCGATPVFADVDRHTLNIDPNEVERRITPRTRAILPVHLAGRPCDMDALRDIASRHDLYLVEDAAHAIEARYHGRKVGALGDAGCFSFYVTKNMTTVEGGMLCTDRPAVAKKAEVLALHGMSADAWSRYGDAGFRHYEVVYTGYKYNMTDVQASIGLCQLSKLGGWLQRRNVIWNAYDNAFADLPCVRPAPAETDTVHARHLYMLMIDAHEAGISRDAFIGTLHSRGVGTGVHYRPLHIQPYYRKRFDFVPEDYPNALWVGERTVSLPLASGLTDAQVARVIGVVRETLSR